MSKFDELSEVLFEGNAVAFDFKTMPGNDGCLSRDQAAESLLESMQRVGLIWQGQLVDPNQ